MTNTKQCNDTRCASVGDCCCNWEDRIDVETWVARAAKGENIAVCWQAIKAGIEKELTKAKEEAYGEIIKEMYRIHNDEDPRLCSCTIAEMLKSKFLNPKL